MHGRSGLWMSLRGVDVLLGGFRSIIVNMGEQSHPTYIRMDVNLAILSPSVLFILPPLSLSGGSSTSGRTVPHSLLRGSLSQSRAPPQGVVRRAWAVLGFSTLARQLQALAWWDQDVGQGISATGAWAWAWA